MTEGSEAVSSGCNDSQLAATAVVVQRTSSKMIQEQVIIESRVSDTLQDSTHSSVNQTLKTHPEEPWQDLLGCSELEKVSPFQNEKYEVNVSAGIHRLHMRVCICMYSFAIVLVPIL